MTDPGRIVVIQTAFLGDVILTLPMIQLLARRYPLAAIDVVTTPQAAPLLAGHPAIAKIIPFDKRGTGKGIGGMLAMGRLLRERQYDVVVAPHRSFRTAVVSALSNAPVRITYSTSAGKFLYNHIVEYASSRHEIERHYALLAPFGITVTNRELPSLFPSEEDGRAVERFFFHHEIVRQDRMIAIAPGSIWNTKRWLPERYAALAAKLAAEGWEVFIIGGKGDAELGKRIVEEGTHKNIHDTTGALSLLQSAELIGRCQVLVTNDSAPLHLAVAMRTPVVAVFGPTVPAFGFAPYGEGDVVVEQEGLSCRPCAIHGGRECPIGTFDCMKMIETQRVYDAVNRVLAAHRVRPPAP